MTRFWRLGDWSLWEDEVFTLSDARTIMADGGVPKNPLGYFLFAGLIHGLGTVPGEFGLRILPAILGVLGIAACGLCFAPIFGARRAAATALILGASTWHLYWSQNARFYTLAQDLALLGGVFAARALLRARGERFFLCALCALALLMLAALAQPAALLLLPAWLAAAVAVSRIRTQPPLASLPISRTSVIAAGILGVLIAAWVGPIWLDFYRTKHDPTALHLLLTSGWYFTPALLGAAAFSMVCAVRRRSAPDIVVGLACLFAAGLAQANALFVRAAAQYLFVLLPFVAALATWPIVQSRFRPWWRAAWLAALVLPAVIDQGLYFTARNGDRPPWREAFAEVHRLREPGDLVFTNNANVGEYYFAPLSLDLRHPSHVQNLDRYTYASEQHWARQPRRAWFVVNIERLDEWPMAARDAFKAMLADRATLVKSFDLDVGVRDLDVLVYLRP